MSDFKDRNDFDEEAFLKKVESAARKGSGQNIIVRICLAALPWCIAAFLVWHYVLPKYNAFNAKIDDIFSFVAPVEDQDLVIEDHGIFGYTAANFEEAILGDPERKKKLEVYSAEISDVGTLTEAGLLKLGIFTKNQLITYHGTAVYTVDLSKLGSSDISYDNTDGTVTLRIPHAEREEINIPEDKIQFGDKTGGLLAFGEIKMTAEQAAEVQAEARARMEQKLDEENTAATADRFAKLSVWEIYYPIIRNVAKECSLIVEFRQ